MPYFSFFFFFFNDTATTEIYTLSLHDALPIWKADKNVRPTKSRATILKWTAYYRTRKNAASHPPTPRRPDRKSTRLNSSHSQISYAVFCLKKKKKQPDSHIH